MEEREIDLCDLLLNILLHWRGLIALMLIGGILMGGFSYVKSDKDAKAAIAAFNEQNAALEDITNEEEITSLNLALLREQMTGTQISNVEGVISNEELLKERQAYVAQSVLMQMDPSSVPESQIIFAVTAEDLETAKSIARIYESSILSTGLNQYLAKKFDMDETVVDELWSVQYSANSLSEGSNSFKIVLMHSDEATCRNMANAVIDFANSQTAHLTELFGEHELIVVGQYFSNTLNSNILNTQKSYTDNIVSLTSTIEKAKDAFTEEEIAYYNRLTDSNLAKLESEENSEENAELLEPEIIPAHVSAKYVVLGIILFAFLYAAVIAIAYVFNNKLKACDRLQNLYGIAVMGQIPTAKQSKKPLHIVDDWLIQLWNRNKRQFTPEEATQLAAVAVKIAAKNAGVSTLSLIGCNMSCGTDSLCQQLKDYLTEAGLQVEILDNVIYNAEAMEKLNDTSAAVLVEKTGSTLYREIEEELSLLKRQDIKSLGVIVEC